MKTPAFTLPFSSLNSLFSFSLVHAKTSHVTQKHKGLRYHSMQQKLASETWGLPLAAIGQLGTKE
jgi:hypothetical protein